MADEITVAEYLVVTSIGIDITDGVRRAGQSFQAAETAFVTSAFMSMRRGTPTGSIVLYIYACDGDYLPIGSPIATSNAMVYEDIPETYDDFTAVFDGTVELTAGEKYAVIAAVPSGDVEFARTNFDDYSPGTTVFANDGVNFSILGSDQRFGVYGSAGGGGGGDGGGVIPTDVAMFESWGF
jgi:hypothetical protein